MDFYNIGSPRPLGHPIYYVQPEPDIHTLLVQQNQEIQELKKMLLEMKVKTVEQPVKTVEQPVKMVEQPVKMVEQPVKMVEQPVINQLQKVDTFHYNFFNLPESILTSNATNEKLEEFISGVNIHKKHLANAAANKTRFIKLYVAYIDAGRIANDEQRSLCISRLSEFYNNKRDCVKIFANICMYYKYMPKYDENPPNNDECASFWHDDNTPHECTRPIIGKIKYGTDFQHPLCLDCCNKFNASFFRFLHYVENI